jgi:hypothetical protein
MDDDRFEPGRHVGRVSLPEPGDDEQLRAVTGRLFSRPL